MHFWSLLHDDIDSGTRWPRVGIFWLLKCCSRLLWEFEFSLCRRHQKMVATLSLPLMDDRNTNQTWATTLLHASMYAMVVCHKKWYAKVVWRLTKRPFGREYAWTRMTWGWHVNNLSLAVEKSLPSKDKINTSYLSHVQQKGWLSRAQVESFQDEAQKQSWDSSRRYHPKCYWIYSSLRYHLYQASFSGSCEPSCDCGYSIKRDWLASQSVWFKEVFGCTGRKEDGRVCKSSTKAWPCP